MSLPLPREEAIFGGPLRMSERFGPAVRLRARSEFQAVQQNGRRVTTRHMVLLGTLNAKSCDRLGIIASRRLGSAVVRVSAKRRLREVFRREAPDTAAARGLAPMDIVAIPRRTLVDAPMAEVEREFRSALRRLRGENR